MTPKYNKYQVATAIAILFHAVGLGGILYGDKAFFAGATSMNLLLMLVLLVWTQAQKNRAFFLFVLIIFLGGFLVEYTGVHTGNLFGKYEYGTVLGYSFRQVPVIIGLNWVIIIYCSGVFIHTILTKAIRRIARDTGGEPMRLKPLSVIIDGATLAVFFDWVMEPVAVKLGYWKWLDNGEVPMINYLSWFVVSMAFLAVFHFSKFSKHNKFAIHLLMIQLMFFLLLRTLL